MKLNGSHLVSLAIMAGIGGWMFTGKLNIGGVADPNGETISEREAKRKVEAFRVRVTTLQPTKRQSSLKLRGRTQADKIVSVRAETGGTVEKRPVSKGQSVMAGDLLCVIESGVRGVNLGQAEAQLAQTEEDYSATKKLVRRGFATKSRLRQLKAAYDNAKATIAAAKQDLARTEIRATTTGIVQSPLAEIGDNLSPGGVCATLMNPNPMLFSGQVSERDISKLKIGMDAEVTLVGETKVAGTIRYISPIADAQTRTFTIEIILPNADGEIRDGLTATAQIPLAPSLAYQLSASWLTLADDGQVGVRAVSKANKVSFHPVSILSQDKDIMWVNGLEPGLRVITLGQNYVSSGVLVEPISAAQMKAIEAAKEKAQAESTAKVKS